MYILCRRTARKEKEQAILDRFSRNIELGLHTLHTACQEGRIKKVSVAERCIGRFLQRNSRAADLYEIHIREDGQDHLSIRWSRREDRHSWANLSQGCYVLRSNIPDWSAEELWHAYIHLTEAEAACRIQKTDLVIRPIWH